MAGKKTDASDKADKKIDAALNEAADEEYDEEYDEIFTGVKKGITGFGKKVGKFFDKLASADKKQDSDDDYEE
ncbi:MAG: hypothetical protein LUD72_05015 [Bacteroidales bacterium]|nr:hypothetical protein [Bacteroidales bacterium]